MEELQKEQEKVITTADNIVGSEEPTGDTVKVEESKTESKSMSEAEIQELIDKAVATRLAREKKKSEKELNKYKTLAEAMRLEMNKENIDEVLEEAGNIYKEQGRELPKFGNEGLSEKDEIKLGKLDAEEIIESGDVNNIKYSIEDLEDIEDRSVREETLLKALKSNLAKRENEKKLKENGIDLSILDEVEFKEFSKKLSDNISVVEKIEMYEKVIGKTKTPEPVGDIKDTPADNKLKSFYTESEIEKFTTSDYRNTPGLREIVMKSLMNKK